MDRADRDDLLPADIAGLTAENAALRAQAESLERRLAQIEMAYYVLEDQGRSVVELTEEMAELKKLAEAANRAKSLSLSRITHDLRTPLTAILGFSALLTDGTVAPDADTGRDYARLIHQSGRYILALVDQIMEFSRIEAGKLTLDRRPTALDDVVRDVARMLGPTADPAGVAIDVAVEPGLPPLPLDRVAIERVLANLGSNAIRFTASGGTVRLRAGRRDTAIAVEVADTGVGIAAEDLERILLPFEQASQSGAHPGLGLGLAIAKSLVEAHDGTLAITSAPGQGTTVAVLLPAG